MRCGFPTRDYVLKLHYVSNHSSLLSIRMGWNGEEMNLICKQTLTCVDYKHKTIEGLCAFGCDVGVIMQRQFIL